VAAVPIASQTKKYLEEAVMVYLRYQSGICLEKLRNPQKKKKNEWGQLIFGPRFEPGTS
jgi:hypothetical protein